MDYLKHLPLDPQPLADLIAIRPGQVLSKSLSRIDNCQIMLMSVSAGEEVLSEQYPGDTLYYVLEGRMPLQRQGQTVVVQAGQAVAVPCGQPHAIGGAGEFKMLQLILTDPTNKGE
jgi:quercetin dioxygenase-like cupin family protein